MFNFSLFIFLTLEISFLYRKILGPLPALQILVYKCSLKHPTELIGYGNAIPFNFWLK